MKASIFTDPYSSHEILHIEDGNGMFGAAYDPRRASLPTPWSHDCLHCRRNRFRDLSVHLRREIAILLTKRNRGFIPSSQSRVFEFTVPSYNCQYVVRHWIDDKGQHAHVLDNDNELLRASQVPDEKIVYESEEKMPDRTTVHRVLKFLFSQRAATPQEIYACSAPLTDHQTSRIGRPGYRKKCDTLDWAKICQEIRPSLSK